MTKQNLILIAACLTAGLLLGGEAKARPIKDVNVVNEPNVNVLNNVDVNVTNDTINPVPVVVQNGTTSAPAKEIVEIVKQHSCEALSQLAYQVPGQKQLTITDVAITDLSGTSRNVNIQRGVDGPIIFSRVFEGNNRTFSYTYNSGIVYQPLE